MIYDWARLALASVAIVPPLALLILLVLFKGAAFRRVPTWLTWTQSLAQVALFGGVIGASVEAIAFGRHLPSMLIEALLVASYVGLGAIRWVLLIWWIRDWRARYQWQDRHRAESDVGTG